MKSINIYFCISIIMLSLASCSSEDDTEMLVPPNDSTISNDILTLVNQHRQNMGLSVLTKNETAEQLSIDHTRYMITIEKINHDDFDMRADELKNKESATGMAENVAKFQPDAQSVVDGWLNSPGHRENIEGNYSHTGIAAIKDNQGRYYYTQIFYR